MSDVEAQLHSDWPQEIKLLGGYLSKDGILYDRVMVREVSGVEEDLMAKKDIPIRARIEGVVISCIKSFLPAKVQQVDLAELDVNVKVVPIEDPKLIRQAVIDLPANDRPFILLELRKLSPGPIFWYEASCPRERCQADQKKFTDLRLLKTTSAVDPYLRTYQVDIGGGSTATMKVMLGSDEVKLEEIQETTDDEYTPSLYVRTLAINGKPATYDMVKALGTGQRMKMRWALQKNESDVQTVVKHKCSSCGKEFKLGIQIGTSDFFFPSETSNPWSTSLASG